MKTKVIFRASMAVAFLWAATAVADEGPQQCTLDPEIKKVAIQKMRVFFKKHDVKMEQASFTLHIQSKGSATELELKKMLQLEAECCSELRFQVEKRKSEIWVTVSGPVDDVMAAARLLKGTR